MDDMWRHMQEDIRRSEKVHKKLDQVMISIWINLLKLPSYTGYGEQEDYLDWEYIVDKLFDEHNCPENLRVEVAINSLSRGAATWWRLSAERHDQSFQCWMKLKLLMRREFAPNLYEWALDADLRGSKVAIAKLEFTCEKKVDKVDVPIKCIEVLDEEKDTVCYPEEGDLIPVASYDDLMSCDDLTSEISDDEAISICDLIVEGSIEDKVVDFMENEFPSDCVLDDRDSIGFAKNGVLFEYVIGDRILLHEEDPGLLVFKYFIPLPLKFSWSIYVVVHFHMNMAKIRGRIFSKKGGMIRIWLGHSNAIVGLLLTVGQSILKPIEKQGSNISCC